MQNCNSSVILKLVSQSLSIKADAMLFSCHQCILNQPFVYIFSCQLRKDGLSPNLSPKILVLTKQQPQKTAALLLNENLQERKRSSTKLNPPTSSQKHRHTKPASLRVRQRLLTYFERLLQCVVVQNNLQRLPRRLSKKPPYQHKRRLLLIRLSTSELNLSTVFSITIRSLPESQQCFGI